MVSTALCIPYPKAVSGLEILHMVLPLGALVPAPSLAPMHSDLLGLGLIG